MNSRFAFLAASLVLAVVAGCYTGSAVDTNSPYGNVIVQEPTEPAAEEETGEEGEEPSTVSDAKGLPCELAVLIKTACGECHSGAEPSGKTRITTWEDLTRPSEFDPSKKVAELALARMKSSDSPMPPSGKLGKSEIEILETWIEDGMKKGTCSTTKPDGGTTKDAGKSDAKSDATTPPPPPTVCTSGVTADPEVYGPTMRPGKACISCHTLQSGPALAAGGTVFPSLFEPDDCNGSNAGTAAPMKVLIIDANGAMKTHSVNSAGNFFTAVDFPKPYKAIVVRGNQIREMKHTQTDGDCNGCHTERGKNGAPGRIMAP